ncbi:Kazal-type serine protease inhibitor domain-containing protein 1 [Manis javanica]|nr:Kazal-type serine protease inhibitor domain-containing protein 1 [Manis javanica]
MESGTLECHLARLPAKHATVARRYLGPAAVTATAAGADASRDGRAAVCRPRLPAARLAAAAGGGRRLRALSARGRPLCGSDGRTYAQICRLQEAARARPEANLTVAHPGPCESEPQIVSHPFDIWNVMGQDVIFGCEVFAYPMASIEWRKDGLDIQLPGDDPHISVQFRGGPQRFEVTAWLQIQAVRPSDEGTYRCLAHNALGQVEASASLTVLTPDQLNATGISQLPSLHLASEEEAESEEGEDYY